MDEPEKQKILVDNNCVFDKNNNPSFVAYYHFFKFLTQKYQFCISPTIITEFMEIANKEKVIETFHQLLSIGFESLKETPRGWVEQWKADHYKAYQYIAIETVNPKLGISQNLINDAMIGQTASSNNATLLTNDGNLYKKMKACGFDVMNFKELITKHFEEYIKDFFENYPNSVLCYKLLKKHEKVKSSMNEQFGNNRDYETWQTLGKKEAKILNIGKMDYHLADNKTAAGRLINIAEAIKIFSEKKETDKVMAGIEIYKKNYDNLLSIIEDCVMYVISDLKEFDKVIKKSGYVKKLGQNLDKDQLDSSEDNIREIVLNSVKCLIRFVELFGNESQLSIGKEYYRHCITKINEKFPNSGRVTLNIVPDDMAIDRSLQMISVHLGRVDMKKQTPTPKDNL